ncbi:MAG: hypothetical protein MK179_23155, partial [Pirellulaceae bacterium]|nr:hypothetical protein [Pirellulaceae bacterium]
MLLGRGGWVRNVLHFAVTLVLLDPLIALPVGNSVQEALYLLLAFSLIFIDVDERQEAKASEWSELGIWLFGMNFGFILISAGLFKAMCPLWAAGDGFGITYNLPWIREPALNVGETLLLLMSYGSILLEVGFLIAFLLPALRWVSLIMLCCFFGGLIFPLRLDMIGWIGMGYPILLLSITQLPFCTHPASGHRSPRVRAVAAAGFLYCCLLCTSQFFTRWDFTENDYERLYGDSVGATADNDAFRDGIVYRGVRKLNELLTPMIGANSVQQFNRYCTRQKPWTLFTKRHLIGICEFRVVVTTALGEELHPFNLFNVDLTPGPGTTGLFVCRNLQSQMYALSDLYHRASYAGEDVAELM